MPLTQESLVVSALGCCAVLVGAVAFQKQRTLPFKLAYAAAWPLLGTASILLLSKSSEEMERSLTPSDTARLAEIREANRRITLQSLKSDTKSDTG